MVQQFEDSGRATGAASQVQASFAGLLPAEADRARAPELRVADLSPAAAERGRDPDPDHSDRKALLAECRVSPPGSDCACFLLLSSEHGTFTKTSRTGAQ
jgi:hypothetical protein